MLDFKEELKKYKPALEVDDLQDEMNESEMQDVLKLLQYVVRRSNFTDKE